MEQKESLQKISNAIKGVGAILLFAWLVTLIWCVWDANYYSKNFFVTESIVILVLLFMQSVTQELINKCE